MTDSGQVVSPTGGRQKGTRLLDGLDATVERMRQDPLRLISWSLLLAWFGVSLLLFAVGKIDTPQKGWAIFAWGGGAIALTETLLRLTVPGWREPASYSFIWGIVWIALGLSLWYDSWNTLGPIGVIGLGAGLVAWVVVWQKRGSVQGLEARIKQVKENPVRFVSGSALVIWFGVMLLLMALDVVGAKITPDVGGDISAAQRGWAVFALGGATIFLVETLVRLSVSRWRPVVISSFTWAVVWLAVGMSLWFNNWTALAPIVFIGLGMALLGSLLPRAAK